MKLRLKRYISQFFFLIFVNLGFKINTFFNGKTGFCYPFFYCHSCPAASAACPIKAVEESLHNGFLEGKINLKLLLYPLVTIGLIGTISGRFVCGWVCPIGLLQRVTGKVARRLNKYPIVKKLGQHKIEPYLRYMKYFVFIGLVVLTAYFIGFMFTNICPVGFLVGTIPISILNPGGYYPSEFFYPALTVFILFLTLIFTIERGWCKYFCPVGAMLAPFNKISMLHVSVDKSKCVHCNVCSDVCPMGIDVPDMNRSPECILCGKCVEACPKNIITFNKGGF
jgi:polyferredoxin